MRKASVKEIHLFSAFTSSLEEVFKQLDWGELEMTINREYLGSLQFADDIILCSNDGDELQKMIEELNRESTKVGRKVNLQETKVMLGGAAKEGQFDIDNRTFESVKQYVYLG